MVLFNHMKILTTQGFSDYTLLDTGHQKRLERFGKYILERPDPQAIWQPHLSQNEWEKADARFVKNAQGKEQWEKKGIMSDKWLLTYKDLSFFVKLTHNKLTDVFPE